MNIASNIKRHFQKKVLDTIKAHHLIEQGDVIVVGVSGGPDSICLLHVLQSLTNHFDIRLHAVHINHMLRKDEAQEDEKFTAGFCESLGISCSVLRVDIAAMAKKLGMSLEQAGREARYGEFERYADIVGANKIAVAHNRNDQAETVMMHIIRGTGMAGLIGMEYKRGTIIRPLLNIYRKEIEQYCEELSIDTRIDSSNLKGEFARNRVRLELFPFINESFGADITESLFRLSSLAADDNDYLESCARAAYEGVIKSACMDERLSLKLRQLQELHPAILGRVLKQALCDIIGNTTDIGNVHYRALTDLIDAGKTGSIAELPGGFKAVISYDTINISATETKQQKALLDTAPFLETMLVIPGRTYVKEWKAVINTSVSAFTCIEKYKRIGYTSLVQFFDYDSFNRGINIRTRRNGDIFKPFRSNGTKKLKEYFIDNKIPREKRSGIPLICIDNEVIWIIGYKISDKFKVTENTKTVLEIEYNRRVSS